MIRFWKAIWEATKRVPSFSSRLLGFYPDKLIQTWRKVICMNMSTECDSYWKEMLLPLLSRFSHVRLCDPIDSSPPGSPVPGILQARALEWVAISFSNAWKWKVKVKSLSRVWLLATPWTAAYQAPPSMDFPGKSIGVGYHCLNRHKRRNWQ